MPAEPFLTLMVHNKKDLLVLRQKARLVAHLLCYKPYEQTCIAAGAFAIAHQARGQRGKARICFQIEQDQLHIFVQNALTGSEDDPKTSARKLPEAATDKPLLRLAKPLPREKGLAEREVGSLALAVPGALFAEIVKQNQEVLNLLHELQVCRDYSKPKEEQPKSPSAA